MELTLEQKQEFSENGYLALRQIVPPELVRQARRAINAFIGENGMDPAEMTKYRAQSYCPGLGREPVITDLYNASPLRELAESAVGIGKLQPVTSGQIAMRFPKMDPARPPSPHLDGMYSPDNGVKKGAIANFTALVGVFLSDVPDPDSGNFTIWPGTHRIYERYFREHGPESLLNGMPPVELPRSQQFLARAGDAAFVHYQMGHGIAGNASPKCHCHLD